MSWQEAKILSLYHHVEVSPNAVPASIQLNLETELYLFFVFVFLVTSFHSMLLLSVW